MTTPNKHGGTRPGSGRPALAPGEKTVPRVVRITVTQNAKLNDLGGAEWMRAQIDAAWARLKRKEQK